MKLTKLIIFLSILLLLQSCAILRQRQSQNTTVLFSKNKHVILPKPAELGINLQALHILNAHYKTRSYSTEVAVEASPNHITLVARSGLGTPLFTVTYNGSTINISHLPIPHIEVGAKQALLNFILSYSPKSTLENMLKDTSIVLKSVGKQRLFIYDNKPIVKITYEKKDPWKGHILIENLQDQYYINIDPISVTYHH